MLKCQSCGDQIKARPMSQPNMSKKQKIQYFALAVTHCHACAVEKATGQIFPTTLQHDAGGGQRVIRSTRGLS